MLEQSFRHRLFGIPVHVDDIVREAISTNSVIQVQCTKPRYEMGVTMDFAGDQWQTGLPGYKVDITLEANGKQKEIILVLTDDKLNAMNDYYNQLKEIALQFANHRVDYQFTSKNNNLPEPF